VASRVAVSSAVRDLIAAAATPLPDGWAALVGLDVAHQPREMTTGMGASQCGRCFGWRDDPRHPFATAPDRPPGPGGPTHPTGPAGPRPDSPQRPTR
jgi:hypothetical protein